MNLDELLAREGIRDTLARYNINGDRGDVAALAATFAEDGLLEFPGSSLVGPAAIEKGLGHKVGGNRKLRTMRHHVAASLIEIEGDTARVRSYFSVATDIGWDHGGVYNDMLKQIGDRWLFTRRQASIDWQSPDSVFPPMDVRNRVEGD